MVLIGDVVLYNTGVDQKRNEMHHVFNGKYRPDQFTLCFMQSYLAKCKYEDERKINRVHRKIYRVDTYYFL